jgi:MoaA/NifB/PqqE/SkfB family radical SAM enzyme
LKQRQDGIQSFNQDIGLLFRNAVRISLRNPALALFMYRTMRRQQRAAKVRRNWEERGLHVPPFAIASVTNRCNLQCKGCYSWAQHRSSETLMSADRLRGVLAEAEELGMATEASLMLRFPSEFPALFVAFPGGEALYSGCLAAGRGFIHISPGGRVEPCPFSPFSDASLNDLSLKEALQSELLKAIRESDVHLSGTDGGCALWQHREWVASLLRSGQSTLTGIRAPGRDGKGEMMRMRV